MGIRNWIVRFFRVERQDDARDSARAATAAPPEQPDADTDTTDEEGAAEITNVPRGTRLSRGSTPPSQDPPPETS
ncbi:MAG: hypothetical protein ACLFVO_06835 [Chloroflexaceae bacterium]